jgi:hypothetical protein
LQARSVQVLALARLEQRQALAFQEAPAAEEAARMA